MRFAVLTRRGSAFGVELLERLAKRGFRPDCIGIECVTWPSRWRMARFLARKTGLANAVWHNARIWSRVLFQGGGEPIDYRRYSDACFQSTHINSDEMEQFLRSRSPELIVLGQSGIVRPNLIEIPPWGVINCHPGRLPHFRGVDVVPWALWHGSTVEATLHYIDKGVDTGDVIRRAAVPVLPDDAPDDVLERAVGRTLDMLADAVEDFSRQGRLPASAQPKGVGKQYYLMPVWTRRRFERKWPEIRQGLLAEDLR